MSDKKKDWNKVEIKNKRAKFEFEFIETFDAGLQLFGSEIKSIRNSKANITDGYCFVSNSEVFAKNIHIAEYEKGGYANHEPNRDRKLLLTKHEISRIAKKLKDKGITLVPVKLYISEKGWAKLQIALAKGKKLYDKRESIKDKDIKRDLDRKLA